MVKTLARAASNRLPPDELIRCDPFSLSSDASAGLDYAVKLTGQRQAGYGAAAVIGSSVAGDV